MKNQGTPKNLILMITYKKRLIVLKVNRVDDFKCLRSYGDRQEPD